MDALHIANGQAFNVLRSRIPDWSGWLATMVFDSNGGHLGVDGTSKTISNDIDLQLLLALRSKCSVIVTTGATARAENYKNSRFAPIAFITRNRNSLSAIPAVLDSGEYPNVVLEIDSEELDFVEIGKTLRELGFDSFLFEGGPTTLRQLLLSSEEVQLVQSETNIARPTYLPNADVAPKLALPNDSLTDERMELKDDFSAGDNRVTRWLKLAS